MMPGRRILMALLLPAPALGQNLGVSPPVPALPPLPSIQLGQGVVAVPPGVWRVVFAPGRDTLDAGQRAAIGRLAAELHRGTIGRVTLLAETSTGEDLSTHRRQSLVRGRVVREALEAGGLAATRIDIRALGRTASARDAVDVLAPTAPRG